MASAAEQLAANFNFGSISKAKELRSRIFFTLGALIVARLGSYAWLSSPWASCPTSPPPSSSS